MPFFRVLLVVLVLAAISFLFPNNLKFKYQFEQGLTWRYDDLEAPFDFPIRKTEAELKEEREQIAEAVPPVYELDNGIVQDRKAAFTANFRRQLEAIEGSEQFRDVLQQPNRYLNFALNYLDRVYQRGMIKVTEEDAERDKDFMVTVLRGNVANEQPISNLLTPELVRRRLDDTLLQVNLREAEFIFPLLEEQLQANLFYNDSLTQRLRRDALEQISPSRGMVRKGDLIVAAGAIVTEDIFQKLVSFREQYEQQVMEDKTYLGVYLGYVLLTALVMIVFAIYLRHHAKLVYNRFNKLVFIMLWPLLYSYLVFLVEGIESLNSYLIPFAIAPIVIKTFYNERLALFTHLIIVLIASFLSSLGYEFTFLQILAGIIVVLSNIDTRDWSRFFNSIIFIFLGYALGYLGLSLVQEGSLSQIDWSVYLWIFLNAFLTLLAYPMIPLLERLFGFVSPITLMELSDMNRPLLRELALRAPGTLQHSLQVANMAEAAARRIGADPLVVKVAALYHDIGKTANPEFFIENQAGRNPHEGLSELESARIIISHVTDGVQMAKKNRLPTNLIDFIRTHHGTTKVEYFYRSYVKKHPDETVDESLFRYPGPRPRTKEETVLMMADSIEAACKSLKNPTENELFGLIDKIVTGKISGGQFEDSQIAFREVEECKGVFKQIMKSVHHPRIEYPEDQEQTPTEEQSKQVGSRQ